MTDTDNIVCGCSTCYDTDDVNDCYKAKQRPTVAAAEVKMEEMEDNTKETKADKAKFEAAQKAGQDL